MARTAPPIARRTAGRSDSVVSASCCVSSYSRASWIRAASRWCSAMMSWARWCWKYQVMSVSFADPRGGRSAGVELSRVDASGQGREAEDDEAGQQDGEEGD